MQHHQKSSISFQRVIKLLATLGSEGPHDRPASLTVVPNILRHQTPAVLSSLTNSLLTPLALEVAHFSFICCIISVPSSIVAPVIKLQ